MIEPFNCQYDESHRSLNNHRLLACEVENYDAQQQKVPGLSDVCDALDSLQNELSNRLYFGSILADRIGSIFEVTGDPAVESFEATFTACNFTEDAQARDEQIDFQPGALREHMQSLLVLLGEAADFFCANLDFFPSLGDAVQLYGSFFVRDTQKHRLERLTSRSLVRPSNIAPDEHTCVTVVVRFLCEDDENDFSGWSPFLLGWPSGRIGHAKLDAKVRSPPRIGDYDVTITVDDFMFHAACSDDFDSYFDDEDASVVGDVLGIFQSKENLKRIVLLACNIGQDEE